MFVDLHSHILYGLDDGAKTLDDSLEMLELARRSGTSDIVATPHASARYPFQPALVEQRIAELSGRVGIRIHRGCDFHLQFDNIEDAVAHPEKYTINGKGYLLVEFPDLSLFGDTGAILSRLLDAGMIPIISHPERHRQLPRRLDDLERWIDLGCAVQVTAKSYSGFFGRSAKDAAYELLERGLTHFVASDAHDARSRTPNLRETYDLLVRTEGEERIGPLFVENPRAVLSGEGLEFELPRGRHRRRKWYQLW